MADRWTYLELTKPLLPIVRLLLAERKLDQLMVTVLGGGEGDHMALHVTEVVSRVLIFARTQTLWTSWTQHYTGVDTTNLVVLVLPLVRVRGLLEPHLVLGDGVEVDHFLAFPYLLEY